jgi:tRNA A-37 threonylcarbamoyl transferase component Bud32
MDPTAILNTIYEVAMVIKQSVKQVKANEKQCKRLAERIDAIISALKSMNNSNLQRSYLHKSLLNFRSCTEQCLEFIAKFNDETSWFFKVFHNQNFKNEFEELNFQLSQSATDLNLSINLKQIFDLEVDESDQKIDLYTIQSKLDEIASMMAQRQEQQLRHYEKIEQHICRRFNSFKHHLETNIIKATDPVRAQEIAQEEHAFRHIPYYDLIPEKHIGQGGFANVYRGKWLSQDHEVAIKIIQIQQLGDRVKEDFVKEISTMYRIRYDHILNIFGACMEPGNYALIVEYMSLGSLYDVLRQKAVQLTWCDRWSIALQMTKGINHLHTHSKPIIHRDIKSLNVLMTRGGQDFLVKIGDFGLAKIRHETSRQSSHSSSVGTLPWKAPEILRMAKHSEASDVYALGIVLWELATGCEPYEESDESTISAFVLRGDRLDLPKNIPNLFMELISRAWMHEPSKRPTCQQLLVSMKEGYSEFYVAQKLKVRKHTICPLS